MVVIRTSASQISKNKSGKNENKKTEIEKKQRIELHAGSSSSSQTKRSRTKCPGVRIIGRRVYDSVNGKTCHQCRQKTIEFSVSCKNEWENKQCIAYFCQTCLLNRYGEKAAEAAAEGDWKCPKCRGICNCSVCMKKRGCRPTGTLVPTAKAGGFSSVSEMLQIKGFESIKQDEDVPLINLKASNKEPGMVSTSKQRKEDYVYERSDTGMKSKPLKASDVCEKDESSKMKKLRKNDYSFKDSKKLLKNLSASLMKASASNKTKHGMSPGVRILECNGKTYRQEPGMFLPVNRGGKTMLMEDMIAKLKSKTMKSSGNAKKTGNSKMKKLRKNDGEKIKEE